MALSKENAEVPSRKGTADAAATADELRPLLGHSCDPSDPVVVMSTSPLME